MISATTFSNPPAAPFGLTATAASASQINLAWTDNSSDESGFKIERSGDGGANWTPDRHRRRRDPDLQQHRPGRRHQLLLPRQCLQRRRHLRPQQYGQRHHLGGDAPHHVTATALSSTSIRVNWTDASNNETSFKLEQSSDAGVTWTLVATPAANAITYTLTGLTPNTAYRYRLRACNALGESPNSAVASITTTYHSRRPHRPDRHGLPPPPRSTSPGRTTPPTRPASGSNAPAMAGPLGPRSPPPRPMPAPTATPA